jgi:hypothetical protein
MWIMIRSPGNGVNKIAETEDTAIFIPSTTGGEL